MVDYWLDSSVFIEGMKGPYGFDLAPRFWTVLDARVRRRRDSVSSGGLQGAAAR